MPDILWLDLETRSRCDLRAQGVYNYALDASTEILCMCWAINDGPVQTWIPGAKTEIRTAPTWAGTTQFRAHNAAFERLMLQYILEWPVPLEQFYCTAAQARANCAPGSLEDVGRFAGSSMRKDHRGAQLVRQLCIPQANGTFNDDPELLAQLYAYCAQDVETMRAVSKGMRDLSPEELTDYHVNERINDRGVLLDKPLADAAVRYAAEEMHEIQALVRDITAGAVTSVRSPKMRDWVRERLGPDARRLMVVHKNGEAKVSIDKNVRANLLALAEENPDEVPADVADVIQCADDLWASSVAKFARAAALADLDDNRVRGAFVFAGGSATGRASSYGLQAHNYPRKTALAPEDVRAAMVSGDEIVPAFGKRVTDVLKGMLRPSLIAAAGKSLVVCDWSSIEARITPWASIRPGSDSAQSAEQKLDLFRTGADVYITNAVATFGGRADDMAAVLKGPEGPAKADADHKRQVGKVQELACGFGGGVGAFAAMGRIYGLRMGEDEAWGMVRAWRRANPWAVSYWQELEEAYMRAMRNPGSEISVGRIVYYFDGLHLWYMLPSGRVLCYPYARLENGSVTYAKCSWKPAADATEWPRATLWKGLACENITQAIAADILRWALRQLEALGVVLHVHDEIVVETDDPDHVASVMRRVMTTAPDWAYGLPLSIGKPVITARYQK